MPSLVGFDEPRPMPYSSRAELSLFISHEKMLLTVTWLLPELKKFFDASGTLLSDWQASSEYKSYFYSTKMCAE